MEIRPNSLIRDDFFSVADSIKDSSIDLVVCDGPYGILNKEWDRIDNIQLFNLRLIGFFSRIMKPGASLYLFGKYDCIDFIDYRKFLNLESKIIWCNFCRLHQGKTKYTNNYELICYFTKNGKKTFNLEDIRIPQMTSADKIKSVENSPCVKYGKYKKTKFNPNGKNPGDVWNDIKALTCHSKELIKSELNTVQKPIQLFDRIIKASSNVGDLILDPFMGTGSSIVSAKRLNRRFIGIEQEKSTFQIAKDRVGAEFIDCEDGLEVCYGSE